MANKRTMYRGDAKSIPVEMLVSEWTPGGSLFFAAKKQIDNDLVDSSAKMKTTLTDANIASTDSQYVRYSLDITKTMSDVDPGTYIAEFQFVDSLGRPTTFAQFSFEILGDVNRRTT